MLNRFFRLECSDVVSDRICHNHLQNDIGRREVEGVVPLISCHDDMPA